MKTNWIHIAKTVGYAPMYLVFTFMYVLILKTLFKVDTINF